MRSKWGSLRTPFVFPTLRKAIADARLSTVRGFRVCEFSVQGDHIHLLVEAETREALHNGVRALAIRIAKRVNRLVFERGPFFADRYHSLELTTPRAVRFALIYVFGNFRKHARVPLGDDGVDVYSSAPYFLGFVEGKPCLSSRGLEWAGAIPVDRPQTWLLAHGWKRHGLISIGDSPMKHSP
ncbi:MAG: transposase [Myxococcota bacterium]